MLELVIRLRGILRYTLLIYLCFLIINQFICLAIIQGSSMEPALYNGDYYFVIKKFYNIDYNDIVYFKYSDNSEYYYNLYGKTAVNGNAKHVKRVVGMPGDHIQIIDNKTYVNGELISSTDMELENQDYFLDQNSYFLVGDNSANSFDSRMHGPVDANAIKGKLITNK